MAVPGGGAHTTLPTSEMERRSRWSTLLTLVRIDPTSCDAPAIDVAWSYDGRPWERAPSALGLGLPRGFPCDPECSQPTACVFVPDGRFEYRVDRLHTSELPKASPESSGARFLQQASFGPSRASLDDFLAAHAITSLAEMRGKSVGKYADYIVEQMALNATSLRAYFRKRLNPSVVGRIALGSVIRPCDANARYSGYALGYHDTGALLRVVPDAELGGFEVAVGGAVRTHAAVHPVTGEVYNASVHTEATTRAICELAGEFVGASVSYTKQDLEDGAEFDMAKVCNRISKVKGTNPAIQELPGRPLAVSASFADGFELVPVGQDAAVGRDAMLLTSPPAECTIGAKSGRATLVRFGNSILMYDQRVATVENTLEAPASKSSADAFAVFGTGDVCPSARKSFLNEHSCVRHRTTPGGATPCAPEEFVDVGVLLGEETLAQWYKDGVYVYEATGLRLEDHYAKSVCTDKWRSRWIRTDCGSTTKFRSAGTQTTIAAAIAVAVVDEGRSLDRRDVVVADQGTECDVDDPATVGATVSVDGICWLNIHPDEGTVFDFTEFVRNHPGNEDAARAGRPNPIAMFAQSGSYRLTFPSWHPMDRWKSYKPRYLKRLGNAGDTMPFAGLPTALQTEAFAEFVGADTSGNYSLDALAAHVGVEVCGSPNEVGSDPMFGARYATFSTRAEADRRPALASEVPIYNRNTKRAVPLAVSMTAEDQLRQRASKALSDIIVVSEPPISDLDRSESYLSFYDIFIANAFGNFFDILKQVTYHPMMGRYLSFLGNKAYHVFKTYPDENYAREIMQLFSVGLWQLEDDGTQIVDSATGQPYETYTNEDVVALARIFTGFGSPPKRPNLDTYDGNVGNNDVDPMVLAPTNHDRFPKHNLEGGFIGDGYPLCAELPTRPFLAAGATFKFTGTVSAHTATFDGRPSRGLARPLFEARAEEGSALYATLCARDNTTGRCTFPSTVTLSEPLPCTGPLECSADYVRVVALVDKAATPPLRVYYSYVPAPCVNLAFFNGGRYTQVPRTKGSDTRQCADPTSRWAAAATCCAPNITDAQSGTIKDRDPAREFGGRLDGKCLFSGEQMTYAENVERCQRLGGPFAGPCPITDRWPMMSDAETTSCGLSQNAWTQDTCALTVQVMGSGRVGIVAEDTREYVQPNSGNNFQVFWEGEAYPRAKARGGCGARCTEAGSVSDPSCICEIEVRTTAAFESTAALPDSAGSIRARLTTGAWPPESYGPGVYHQCLTAECGRARTQDQVKIHVRHGRFGADTIFELLDEVAGQAPHLPRYLLNTDSTVHVADGRFKFRNPPVRGALAPRPRCRAAHHGRSLGIHAKDWRPARGQLPIPVGHAQAGR